MTYFCGHQKRLAKIFVEANTGDRMKKLALALLLAAPMAIATVAQAKTVTVRLCDSGESGVECRTVTYEVRPPNKPVPLTCMVSRGEAAEVPCATKFGIPSWLAKFNAMFGNRTPTQADLDRQARMDQGGGGQ